MKQALDEAKEKLEKEKLEKEKLEKEQTTKPTIEPQTPSAH